MGVRLFVDGTEVQYDASLVQEKAYAHVSLGQPVARIERTSSGTTTEHQVHSTLEHMVVSLDDSGDLVTGFVYGPFGEILGQLGGLAVSEQTKRFNNKYFDDVSGLSYYGFRYYDAVSMAWTQADPFYRVVPDAAFDEPRRMNLYGFSLNNPLSYVDPDGLRPDGYTAADPDPVDNIAWPQARAIIFRQRERLFENLARLCGHVLCVRHETDLDDRQFRLRSRDHRGLKTAFRGSFEPQEPQHGPRWKSQRLGGGDSVL